MENYILEHANYIINFFYIQIFNLSFYYLINVISTVETS